MTTQPGFPLSSPQYSQSTPLPRAFCHPESILPIVRSSTALGSGPGSPPLGVVAPVEEVEEEEGKREERAGELVDLDGHHAVGHVAGGVRAGVEVVAGAQAHVRHAAAVVDLERRDEKKRRED